MKIEFFLPMRIPTVTHQMKRVVINKKTGKPNFYESPELKDARNKFESFLNAHVPESPIEGAVSLNTTWIFKAKGKFKPGMFKTSRPDTDNMVKLLKDCMTVCGFWKDDAQVCWEHISKIYGPVEGIGICVEMLVRSDIDGSQ